MTIAFVQKGANSQVGGAGASGNTPTITGVTAGNWLVALGWSASSLSANYTPTTPAGWTVGVQAISVLNGVVSINSAIYFKKSTGGGSESCAFNWGPSDTYSECCIFEVSVTSGVLTLGPTARNSGNGIASLTVGPTTTTGAAALVAAVANMLDGSYNGTNISVASSGYTGLYNDPSGAVYIPGDSAYKIAASGTQQASWTWTTNSQGLGSLATFIEGSSGATTTTATAAAGTATVSGAGASSAKTAGTAAAGTATVSAVASASAVTTATASVGVATVSGAGSSAAIATATAAAGTATVSAVGAGVNGTAATAATGTATVSATAAATSRTLGQADGVATVSGAGASFAATAGSATGLATVSGVGASSAATTATPAAGAAIVSGVGNSIAAGQTTAIPADGVATVSAQASSIVATTAVPAAGSAFVSATTPSASGGGNAWGKKKRRQQVQAEVNARNLEIIRAELEQEAKAEVVEAIADEYDDDEDVLMLLL